MLEKSTAEFIDAVCRLPAASLAAAYDRAVELRRSGGRDASRATKLSAAQLSQIDHTVRAALLPRAAELTQVRPSLHSHAMSVAAIAARAVLKRATLTREQYSVLVEPLVMVGVAAPAHPEDAGADTERLAEVGRAYFASFATDPVLKVVELPDGLGVCLVHAVRGGGKLYVAPDESALFVDSATDFDRGLAAFRDGARTPSASL